ncbi:MAG: GNAT family N-acetyltransferase [Bryobacteraceae bacterium]
MFQRAVTGEIEIRLWEEHHAAELSAAVDRNRAYLREWLPWVDHHYSAADAAAFIRGALEQSARNDGFHAGIWVRGAIAGSIGVHRIDWSSRNTSIGYWLDQSAQGRGVVTACCRAVLDHLFGELNLHRVEIRCGEGNHKSCAIAERLGFTREGVLREAQRVGDRFIDLVVYGMLRRDWR